MSFAVIGSTSAERAAALERVLAEKAAEFDVPGVAAGIVHGGDELTASIGVTSVENPLPVDSDTLYSVASITKPVTVTALMRLVERGQLDFDAPLRAYLPDLRFGDEEIAARVTMRDVVTHRVGLHTGLMEPSFGEGDDALARWVAHLAGVPQRAKLGEVWCYSGDFGLTGRVIEAVTGMTYEAAVKDLVLDPLGMARSTFFTSEAITYRVAIGHSVVDGRPAVLRPRAWTRSVNPSGGLMSTVRDLLRFMRLHLSGGLTPGGARLLTAASVEFMASAVERGGSHGAPWWRYQLDGIELLEHGGGMPGFIADLVLVPARQFGIVVLANVSRMFAEDRVPEINTVTGRVVDAALATFLGLRAPADVTVTRTAAELSEYAGTYVGKEQDLELSVDGTLLAMRFIPRASSATAGSIQHLAFYDKDKIVRVDGPRQHVRGEFQRGLDGKVTWFRPHVTTVYRRS